MTLIEPSWDVAREAAGKISHRLSAGLVPLKLAIGRVLAEDARSLVDLPTYETSAMDGYAVSSEKDKWRIIGDVKAGEIYSSTLNEGQALSIATGAVIPKGTYGILRWENALVDGEYVEGSTSKNKDFRPAGSEASKDEVLVPSGTVLKPGAVGLLAAAGHDQVLVVRKPKVVLLLLGDEIQLSGIPKNGLVRDSLGIQIPAWLEKFGCDVSRVDYVEDNLEKTIQAIKTATSDCDLLVTTGGTADGPRDFLHETIRRLDGIIYVDKVAMRPGHPQLLAQIGSVPLLGLPGNPLSAVVALLTLGQPLIASLQGISLPELRVISSNQNLEAQPNFTRLVPGVLLGMQFIPGKYLGSAMLRSLVDAQGFAVITNPQTTMRWLELPT